MPVRKIKIVKNGTLTVEAFEEPSLKDISLKNLCGIGGNSSVVFIESDAKILVDTGFEEDLSVEMNENLLINDLKRFGIKPEDIDAVFITHWHLDHFGNLPVFKESEILTSKTAVERFNLDYKGVKDGERIADGVRVMYTPGHTIDHASLLVRTENLRYSVRGAHGGRLIGIGEVNIAIAGDAVVSSSYYITGKVWKFNSDFYSEEEAIRSIKRLEEVADYIIPGHGGMFRVRSL